MQRIVVMLGIVLFAAAPPAHANTGIGFLALAIPASIVALVPAILVEAPVLARFLRVTWKRGLWLSAIANVVSTIVGGLIAIASSFVIPLWTEMSREAVLASLLPMLFISWWLEHLVVRRMLPPDKRPLSRRATGIANSITYTAMAIGVAILVPPASAIFSRFRLVDPLNELGVARMTVTEHFQQHSAFPPPGAIPTTGRNVRGIVLEPGGRLVMTLSYPASPVADGKRIVYEPTITDGRITAWRCSSPDLEARHLPAACR